MQALILAAGLGTRLLPLTKHVPKALVPIGDRSSAGHALDAVRAAGILHIALNAHHHAPVVAAFCAEQGVLCSQEPELLGTAGGLAQARQLLGKGDDVFVYNADMWCPGLPVREVLSRWSALQGSRALLLYRPDVAGAGNMGVDEAGQVVRLRQRSIRKEARGGWFTGLHVVSGQLPLPTQGCLVGDVYIPWLENSGVLSAMEYQGPVHDVGTAAQYLSANLEWLRARGQGSYVAEDALVSAELEDCIVHKDAQVLAPCVRSVIGPGMRVTEPTRDAIVLGGETVLLGRT